VRARREFKRGHKASFFYALLGVGKESFRSAAYEGGRVWEEKQYLKIGGKLLKAAAGGL